MKIGVIHPDSGWILSTIARRLCVADPEHFEAYSFGQIYQPIGLGYNVVIPQGLDGIYYIDVQNCWFNFLRDFPSLNHLVHIGFFTHLDYDANKSFRLGWDRLDGIIHMAQRYYDRFVEQGWYCADRMVVLRPGEVITMAIKKITIGICQRGEHVGKGTMFLPEVIKDLSEEVRDGLELIFCGQGWMMEDNLSIEGSGQYHGISARNFLEDTYEVMPYACDYLLIPSLWEGGPMALLEALAAGIPIIAAEVGWVKDFYEELKIKAQASWDLVPLEFWVYPPGDTAMLQTILTSLVHRRLDCRAVVAQMSYRRYAADVLAFFEKIKESIW